MTLLVLAMSCISAASPLVEDGMFYFDCDTPNGHFSEWRGPIKSSDDQAASGFLRIAEQRGTARWWPVASIVFEAGSEDEAGLQLFIDPTEPEHLQATLHAREMIKMQPIKLPTADAKIPFSVSISKLEGITVTIDDFVQSARLSNFETEYVRFSCSSGQFKFWYRIKGY